MLGFPVGGGSGAPVAPGWPASRLPLAGARAALPDGPPQAASPRTPAAAATAATAVQRRLVPVDVLM
jgi:hypothetical protein